MVAFGVAKYYKRYSFARLPGEGFLFCEEKEPKVTRGGPRDPLPAKLRLDTNDALASSVRRRRYALKVPAAHFYVGFSRNKIKITPYKRRLIPLREYEMFPGGGGSDASGVSGSSPSDFWLLFFIEK